MIKKIDILGLKLDNYTVREAIRRAEVYLDNQELNTIEYVSAQMLMESERDSALQQMLSTLDLAVIGDKEILLAAGNDTMQRLRETEENDFFFEFFRRVERNRKSVFLLSETNEAQEHGRKRLLEAFPRLLIAGGCALENCTGNLDGVINDMNATTPDVIASVIPSPQQEHFFLEHKDKMNANIWYGMGSEGMAIPKRGVRHMLSGMVRRRKLKSSMQKYGEK